MVRAEMMTRITQTENDREAAAIVLLVRYPERSESLRRSRTSVVVLPGPVIYEISRIYHRNSAWMGTAFIHSTR